MSHLVKPITKTTLADCCERVMKAHAYLSQQGQEATIRLAKLSCAEWGTKCKRVRVQLPATNRPQDIGEDNTEHSLAEVINQCATIERLVAALKWAQNTESGLSKYNVECCHPTTSSGDNDLVLRLPSGNLARFEVSDVANEEDGNSKEERSLVALNVLNDAKGLEKMRIKRWPTARLFLVVSKEFGEKLAGRKRDWLKGVEPHCRYTRVGLIESTLIFEIHRGGK